MIALSDLFRKVDVKNKTRGCVKLPCHVRLSRGGGGGLGIRHVGGLNDNYFQGSILCCGRLLALPWFWRVERNKAALETVVPVLHVHHYVCNSDTMRGLQFNLYPFHVTLSREEYSPPYRLLATDKYYK